MSPEGRSEGPEPWAGRLVALVSEHVASHRTDAGALFDHAAALVGLESDGSCFFAVLIQGGEEMQPIGVFHGVDSRKVALQSSLDGTSWPVGAVTREVLATGTPSVLGPAAVRASARAKPWAATLVDDEQDARALIVAMRALGRPVGVMAVIRPDTPLGYSGPEIQAAQRVGDILGLAARVLELSDDVERLAGPVGQGPLGDARLAGLSSREREILKAIERGLSSREIGQELYLSARTVEWHRARIIAKLGTTTRAELVAIARGMSA
jgi:DNA-binding CsgD family transcriptional regulator